jgi:hypothetical protein
LINNPLQFGNNPDNPPHIRDVADQFNQGILGVKYSENSTGNLDLQQATANAAAPNAPESTFGSQVANELGVPGNGPVPVLSRVGKSTGNSFIAPTQAASSSRPMLRNPTAPELSSERSAFADGSKNAADAPRPVSYPRLRRVDPDGRPLDPDQPAPPVERAPMIGIFSGQPMSRSPFALPLGGLTDNSESSGKIDLVNMLVGPAFRNPAPPAQDAGRPERSLGRRIDGQPHASISDAGAPAMPFVPNSALIAPDRQDAFVTGASDFSPTLPAVAVRRLDRVHSHGPYSNPEGAGPPECASTVVRHRRDSGAVRFARRSEFLRPP